MSAEETQGLVKRQQQKADAPKSKGGRPTTYTEAKAAEICKRIVEGQSLRTICRAAGMPSMKVLFDWLGQHAEFAKRYARAKEAQADTHVEEMLDVARKASSAKSSEEAQGYRLLVDTLKWRAAKFKSKSYGEKLVVEADVSVCTLTDEELNARIASFLERQTKEPLSGASLK